MFTKEEKDILLELIYNEQVKHYIVKNEYGSEEYIKLEELKVKIKNM